MKSRALIVILAAVATLTASAAAAQYQSSDRSRFGLKLAFFRPSGGDLKSMNNTWLGPAMTYNVSFNEHDRPNLLITASWFGEEGSFVRASIIPITASYVKRFDESREGSWYVSGGPGLYFAKFEQASFPSWIKSTGTKLGFHVSAGRELSAYYADLRYDFIDKMSVTGGGDVDFSGWTLSLGTHYTF